MRLYELTSEYQRLLDLADDSSAESEQAFADTLTGLKGELDEKIDRCACVLRSLELEADAFRLEEVRLAERRKAIEANRERLRRYVQYEMEQVKLDRCKGPRFFVSIQTNAPKVVVSDEEAIPNDFWDEAPPVLNKKHLLEALKAGTEVPGASMVQERSLRVK